MRDFSLVKFRTQNKLLMSWIVTVARESFQLLLLSEWNGTQERKSRLEMNPLSGKDAAINVCSNQYEVKDEATGPSKSSNLFLCFFEKFRKRLSSEEIIRWKRKSHFFNLEKIPFFILFISSLEVIAYVTANDNLNEILLYNADNKKEIWRFVTYMLLHTDAIHLALNILIQGILGIPLECEQGSLRCAAIYFGGGLAGSLGAFAFAAFPLMAGASGGVYALLTSQIPNVILNYEKIRYGVYRLVAVLVLVASDVIYILCHVYLYNNERPRIGWVAHASGASAGILLGFLVFNGTCEWKRKFRVTSCVILVSPFLMIGGVSLAHFALRL